MYWLAEEGSSNAGTAMMMAGAVLMLVIAMATLRRRFRRMHQGEESAHDRVQKITQTHRMQDDLRQMMVELEDLTRRFSAQLDAKSMRLEQLIEEADLKIKELRLLKQGPGAVASPRPPESPMPKEPVANASAKEHVAGLAGSKDATTQQVYHLVDRGRSAAEIATELREHIGKVELILALRESKV